MRVLRLATSDEAPGRLSPGESAADVAARMLEAASGEPVETVMRAPWPAPGLPDLVDKWMRQYEPDMVLLKANSFWFNYLSVPLMLERKLGPVGKRLSRAGVRVGETPWLTRTAAFRTGRRMLVRALGGATYFTPQEVVSSMEECARRILAHEGVALMIEGPHSRMNHELARKAAIAHEKRRLHVHNSLKRFAAEVHVPFIGQDVLPTREEVAATVGADHLHVGPEAARTLGEAEGAVLVEMWRELHGHSPNRLP